MATKLGYLMVSQRKSRVNLEERLLIIADVKFSSDIAWANDWKLGQAENGAEPLNVNPSKTAQVTILNFDLIIKSDQ